MLFKGILASSTCATSEKCTANNSGTYPLETDLSLWSVKAISIIVHAEFIPDMFLRSSKGFLIPFYEL